MYSPINMNQPFQPFLAAQQTLLRVNGIEGARAYNLSPNSSCALFDANKDVMYIKSTDAGGYATIAAYSYSKIENQAAVAPDFVTREEFEERMEELKNVRNARKSKPTIVDEQI